MGLLDQMYANPDAASALGLLGANMMAGNTAQGFAQASGLLAQGPERRMKQQLANLQLQTGQMTLDEAKRKMADEAAARQVLQQFYQSRGMPGASPAPMSPGAFSPSADGMGPTLPGAPSAAMPAPAGGFPPAQSQAPGGVTPKAEVWKQYEAIGNQLAAKGLVTQAQTYYGLAEKMRPKYATEPRMVKDPATGKLINVLIGEDGSIQPMAYGVKPDMVMENLGGSVRAIDKNSLNGGEAFAKTMTPGEVASNKLGWANNSATLRGQDLTNGRAQQEYALKVASADPFGTLGINKSPVGGGVSGGGVSGPAVLENLNPQLSAQVKALAEGRMAFPSGFALKSPYWQNMLSLVSQYDPTFDATNYNKRSQTANAFAKGQQGNAVRAVNQTLSHMGNLSDAIDKLDNFNGMATPLNYLANPVQKAFGDTRQGTYQQTVQAVASELRKVFSSGGVGNLQELKQWEDSLPVNASKQQQQAYLKNGLDLLQGAMGALDNQYREGMGPKASINDLITPKARGVIGKLSGTAAPTTAQPPVNAQGWVLHTDAKGNKAYVSPDGKQFQEVK